MSNELNQVHTLQYVYNDDNPPPLGQCWATLSDGSCQAHPELRGDECPCSGRIDSSRAIQILKFLQRSGTREEGTAEWYSDGFWFYRELVVEELGI